MVANAYNTYKRKQNRKYMKSNYLVEYTSICQPTTSLALTTNTLYRYHTLLYYIFHQLFLYRLLRANCMDTYFT